MPSSTSIIIKSMASFGNLRADKTRSINSSLSCFAHGCSEFPAHDVNIIRYVSLAFPVLKETSIQALLPELFGEGYTLVDHMQAWTRFMIEMYKPFGDRAEATFFEPYTLAQYIHETNKTGITGSNMPVTDKGIVGGSVWGFSFPYMELPVDTIIGLTTNCNEIRKATDSQHYNEKGDILEGSHSLARKVQLGHTGYRLLWSSGWMIPVLALKIKTMADKKKAGLTNLDALWIAYKIKFYANTSYNDYGDLFQPNSGYISEKCLANRFFDTKLNGHLMSHFFEEQNPIATELGINRDICLDASLIRRVFPNVTISGSNNTTVTNIVRHLNTTEGLEGLIDYVNKAKAAIDTNFTQVKFKFEKSLFKSTAVGVCYEGILKPESKLNRLLFKDEENTVLSVLRESKFIKELK